MGTKSKKEYLLAIWDRYQRVGRQFKTKILDEFCSVCGYCRQYAIRLLGRRPGPRRKRPGPRRRYDAVVLALAAETLQLCTEFGDRRGGATSLKLHGVGHLLLGHYVEADGFFEQGLARCRELGDWRNAAAMLNNLGESARLRGDCQAAAPLYQEALALAREIDSRESEMIYLTNLSGALVGLRQFDRAEAGLRQVIALTATPNSCALSETYCLLAEACLGQEKRQEALTAAQHALALAKESGSHLDMGGAWRTLGRVATDLGRSGGARASDQAGLAPRACFEESLRVFQQIDAQGEQARTLRAWAQYEMRQGRAEAGQKMWGDARKLFLRLSLHAEVQKMDEMQLEKTR